MSKIKSNGQVDYGYIAAGKPMTIYRKTQFFSSVDHLGKWWKILRFLPFKLWILPFFILTENPIKRIRFIGKQQEPFPNRFLLLWWFVIKQKNIANFFINANAIGSSSFRSDHNMGKFCQCVENVCISKCAYWPKFPAPDHLLNCTNCFWNCTNVLLLFLIQ